MFGNAAAASSTVLATQRLPRHTRNTEVLLVKLPEREELLHHLSLLIPAGDLGDIARVFDHGNDVEVGSEGEEHRKEDI